MSGGEAQADDRDRARAAAATTRTHAFPPRRAQEIVKRIDDIQFFYLPEAERAYPAGYPARRRTPEELAADNGGMRLE